jgi:hypothetical protein
MAKEKLEKLNQVPYFKNVEEGDKIFGLVFGKGKVANVWGDGYYTFEIEYDNGYTVPYTPDGVPGWSGKLDYQTVFYTEDIDLMNLDIAPAEKVLSVKKIIKLRDKGKLEIRCPSGIWTQTEFCPGYVMEEYLENNKLHLFRKAK